MIRRTFFVTSDNYNKVDAFFSANPWDFKT